MYGAFLARELPVHKPQLEPLCKEVSVSDGTADSVQLSYYGTLT